MALDALTSTAAAAAPATTDEPFDPFVAGGLIKNKDGSYRSPVAPPPAAQTAPAAPPATPAPFDPFTAGGLIRQPDGSYRSPIAPPKAGLPATPAPPSKAAAAAGTSMSSQPWYQPLWDQIRTAGDAANAVSDWGAHKITYGFDDLISPIPAAAYRSLVRGIPFPDAYTQIQQEHQAQRAAEAEQYPVESTVGSILGIGGSLGGGIRPIPGAGPQIWPGVNVTGYGAREGLGGLFSTAPAGANLAFRAGVGARNLGVGVGLGALGGFGETEGDLQQRLAGAGVGAEWGLGLQALPIVGSALKGVWGSLRPYLPLVGSAASRGAQVGQKAAGMMEEMLPRGAGGVRVPPTFAQAPVEGFPLGVGGATGNPALAQMERTMAQVEQGPALALKQGQQSALLNEATTPRWWGQLASGLQWPDQASAHIANALQNTWQVFKNYERGLWSNPVFTTNLDMMFVQQGAQRFRDSLSLAFRDLINKHKEFNDILDTLSNMPAGATLADVNSMVSSPLKVLARTDGDPQVRMLAGRFINRLDNLITNNPSLVAAGPAAQAAYQNARNFTRTMWRTIGQEPFQKLIRPGADVRGAGSSLFAFGGPTSTGLLGERLPGGVSRVIDGLDYMRNQYIAMGRSGLGNAADAAATNLRQSMVDFIVNAAIMPIRTERLAQGVAPGDLNQLYQWIGRNRHWLISSNLFTPAQLGAIDAIGEASRLGARSLTTRPTTGSETFAHFIKGGHLSLLRIFATPLTNISAGLAGAYLGKVLGEYGEVGIGLLLGLEGGGIALGPGLLRLLYHIPGVELRELLGQAAASAPIAEDLMRRLGASQRYHAETMQFLRALGARLGGEAGQLEMNYGPGGANAPGGRLSAAPAPRAQ